METASDNVQPDEKNHNAGTYKYCDVEDGNVSMRILSEPYLCL